MHYSIRSIRHKNNNTRLGVNMTTLAKRQSKLIWSGFMLI
nr:MAG TPA: hypothetical protein [Caudoviricetes sp.]